MSSGSGLLRRKNLNLPVEFQEVLVTHEIKLNDGLTVDVLRKLVYLYTMGMEYYNLKKKKDLEKFYHDKLNQLLTRKDVEEFLDKNPINFADQSKINLFPQMAAEQQPKRAVNFSSGTKNFVKKNTLSPSLYSNYATNDNIRSRSNKWEQMNREKLLKLIKDKINAVDVKLSKVNEVVSQEIVGQMSQFEENKRKKKVKPKRKVSEAKSEDSSKDKADAAEDIDAAILEQLAQLGGQPISEKVVEEIKTEIPARKRRVSIGQNLMLKEIEEYVEKNMNEMYKALDELKESFASEIKDAEDNGYPEIANGLKEDMEAELENLKDQYEEQRRVETDKIRAKYQKRGSYCRA